MVSNASSQPRRNPSKKNVSFWIDEAVLEKWDEFCTESGISRTQLIMSAVNDKLMGSVNIRNLNVKIDRLAEIVAEFNPDDSSVSESKRLNTRGRVLDQVLMSKDTGLRQEDIKGFGGGSSFGVLQALESLEKDGVIKSDGTGRYWLAEYFSEQNSK